MKLFDNTFNTLQHGLNYAAERNKMISNNIANIDTPFYKAKDVKFKSLLQTEMNKHIQAKRTHYKHLPFSNDNQPFQVVTNRTTTYNHNGNNVDIDKEMSNLAQNQIYYRSLVDSINGKFSTLQTVIRGGR